MIKVEPCRGCGRTLFTVKVANLDVRCDPEKLDAQEAVAALLAGRELWSVDGMNLSGARHEILGGLNGPTPPHVVGTHRCEAVGARLAAPQKGGEAGPPKGPSSPPVAPSVAFLGHSTGPSGVPSAVKRRSDPPCDRCGRPCEPGTYASVEYGDLVIWAEHGACP